jgi:hypothetical protein
LPNSSVSCTTSALRRICIGSWQRRNTASIGALPANTSALKRVMP